MSEASEAALEKKHESAKQKAVAAILKFIIGNKFTRNFAAKRLDKMLYKAFVTEGDAKFPENMKKDRFQGMRAMYLSFFRNIDNGRISKDIAKRYVNTLVSAAMLEGEGRKKAVADFKEKYKLNPPGFFVLSPTQKCNLRCIGCYASSGEESGATLEWDLVDKIMTECHDEMGHRFFVISGGEPFMYKSGDKTILDIPRKWRDSFFLFFTNGTLISEEMAREMGELGNVTVAISVEGFKEHTDERRGEGVFDRTLAAFARLREAKIPFGVSVTATSKNAAALREEKFYDYYFDEQGATYMWIFQYMPIGRKFTAELMITPAQRLEMFEQWKTQIYKKERFVADFWNSAELSTGCLSCGKGYFYIDWNANIMPCVFIPYYKDNVRDLYAQGKKLKDALFSDFFTKGREWQAAHLDKGENRIGNMMVPCLIRDHHREFMEIAKACGVKPEDEAAGEALDSPEYHEKLYEFNKQLRDIVDPYWEKHYPSPKPEEKK